MTTIKEMEKELKAMLALPEPVLNAEFEKAIERMFKGLDIPKTIKNPTKK